MAARRLKSQATWANVKAKLAEFDRPGLVDLIHDLYDSTKDNQIFLHTRFGLGNNVLAPYKKIISRSLWPNVLRDHEISVAAARQAVSDYKNAIGDPHCLTELTVFFCEQASGFCADVGYDDSSYFNALLRMFELALQTANTLPPEVRDDFVKRLDIVRNTSHGFGYGVGDEMDFLLAEHTDNEE